MTLSANGFSLTLTPYIHNIRLFEKCYPEVLTPLTFKGERRERALSNMDSYDERRFNAEASLIRVLRRDDICRRLASLAMRPYDATKWINRTGTKNNDDHTYTQAEDKFPHTTTLLKQFPHNRLLQRMSNYWNHLLVLPSLEEVKSFYHLPTSPSTPIAVYQNKQHTNESNYPYRISLILPAYHEKGSHLLSKLTKALELATNPNEVEVVVVDAGGCIDLELLLPLARANNERNDEGESIDGCCWGRVSIFSYTSGGGRGPCLNFGASVATGRILTFCHSDTTMPKSWDEKISTALESSGDAKKSRANACAFSFGIDTSPEALSMSFDSSKVAYCPTGIRAVEFFTNLRNRLFSLPYGDQVLSLHSCVFYFLGGFPDQCLMEDYDLVSLLRRRAALFVAPPTDEKIVPNVTVREKLAIIPGAPALCSPRRWQKFGVLYVTFMNYKFVNLYAGRRKMSPDDIFLQYYSKDAPKRDSVDSPWEIELTKKMKVESQKKCALENQD